MDGPQAISCASVLIVVITFVVGRIDYKQARKQESIDQLAKKVEELEADLKAERERYEADRETWEVEKLALYERMFSRSLQLPNGEQVPMKMVIR